MLSCNVITYTLYYTYFIHFIREVAHIQYQVFGCFSYAEVEVLTILEVIVINKEQLFTIIALSGKRKPTGNERERVHVHKVLVY